MAQTWRGQTRAPLSNQPVFPPIESGTLKTWIGVGGSPESVVRAAHSDLPLMLAIIGVDPNRFQPYIDLYHRAFAQFGRSVREIACIRTVMSAKPTRERARSFGRIIKQCVTASAPSVAGRQ
jgi:alkanesulfonate monooxygenase SsuD/methylene tetrahydromethanopterin reductase-like flavin-dependent oxidoreductase (luciferase family)